MTRPRYYVDTMLMERMCRLREQGWAFQRIADELNIPLGTVSYSIYRAYRTGQWRPNNPRLIPRERPTYVRRSVHS